MLEISGKTGQVDSDSIKQVVNKFFQTHQISPNTLVELMFVDSVDIQKLNKKYRQVDKSTDILSFPQSKSPGEKSILGTVVICSNEIKFGQDHILKLINHGLLHLKGFDHESDKKNWDQAESRL